MVVVTSTGDNKLEFVREPKQGYLVTKFGNLTHLADNLLCQYKDKGDKVKFKMLNTQHLIKLLQKVKDKKQRGFVML